MKPGKVAGSVPFVVESRAVKPKLSTFAGILALMMPVLYVLSIGPFYHFYVRPGTTFFDVGRFQRWQTYERIYAPVLWLCGKSTMVESAVNWYTALWIRPEP